MSDAMVTSYGVDEAGVALLRLERGAGSLCNAFRDH